MFTELATEIFTRGLLERGVAGKSAAFIEVGLGNINYSFLWATTLGFRCYAVEPLPSEHLIKATGDHKVDLAVGAISDHTGEQSIFIGEVNGSTVSDVSSLNPNWWGGSKREQKVQTWTLSDFLTSKKINSVAVLKVDTEGSEYTILGGLRDIPSNVHPEIIIFEYGGGATRGSNSSGWSSEFYPNTLKILELAKTLGYSSFLILEEQEPMPILLDFSKISDFDALFKAHWTVGNIICTKKTLSSDIMSLVEVLEQESKKESARIRREAFRNTVKHYSIRFISGIRRRLPCL
ncbi:MAG: FkbM family methyltransferase [Verrucomicrobiota bacterium]|nr:FkbM family methyltransferase [Verrucomicrobiota bacterium]